VDNGMVFLLLTGGEVFLRPDFFDIYTPLTRLGIILTLFANGTLVTDKIAQRLAETQPSLTFVATVSSAASGTPTGSVTFCDGTTSLGNETLTGATATYTTTTLSAGTHSITATYSGDTNFMASTSAVLTQLVAAAGYTLNASPSSLTIKSGSTGSTVITLTPVGGFTGTVNFAFGTLHTLATCSFSPTSLTVPSSAPLTTTLTIGTTGTAAASLRNGPAGGMLPAILAALILLPLGLMRRILRAGSPRLACLLLLAAAAAAAAGMIGMALCGGGYASSTSSTSSAQSTPAGTYSIPITVTSGGTTVPLNPSITIQ
jgi:hypothetical protein